MRLTRQVSDVARKTTSKHPDAADNRGYLSGAATIRDRGYYSRSDM